MRKSPSKLFAFTAVPIWLALSVPLMLCGIPLSAFLPPSIINLVIFSPIFLFCFYDVARTADNSYVLLFSSASAATFGVTLWLLTTICYGTLARRLLSSGLTFPFAFVAVAVVTIATHYCFSVFGYKLQYDGP
jgi:hypothetical protein